MKTLSLTVGDEELLTDANLRLFSGVHYGLVGANGVGKCEPLRPRTQSSHLVQHP